MGNDVLEPALRGDGLLFPIFGSEGTKQFEQHGIELRKKMGGENRLHAPIFAFAAQFVIGCHARSDELRATPSSAGWGKCRENQKEYGVAPCFWGSAPAASD